MVDKEGMDLSKLLGDVYDNDDAGTPTRGPASPAAPAKAPEWSDEDHLDKVFADWTPGPTADASHHERDIVNDAPEAPGRLDDDLAAALSAALVDAGGPKNEVAIHLPDVDHGEVLAWPDTDAHTEAPEPAADEHVHPPSEDHTDLMVTAPAPPRAWQRSDDDILPGRPSSGKAPKAHKLRKRK